MDHFYEFFVELYKENYKPLFLYTKRIVGTKELAEDITQDVFYIAYKKKERVYIHENPVGWLYVAIKYKIARILERENRFEKVDISFEDIKCSADDFGIVEFRESMKVILTKEEITLLRDYYECGYTASELSEKNGISQGNLKMRVSRVKGKLRSCLTITLIVQLFIFML